MSAVNAIYITSGGKLGKRFFVLLDDNLRRTFGGANSIFFTFCVVDCKKRHFVSPLCEVAAAYHFSGGLAIDSLPACFFATSIYWGRWMVDKGCFDKLSTSGQ
jgi:hypothetical protein